MATDKQINANRENSQLSTGPKTPEGIAISSQNNFRHGLVGTFSVLAWEDQSAFDSLLERLQAEHNPASETESLLVKRMAQHSWLSDRALKLQSSVLTQTEPGCDSEKTLALYMRYHTQHERAFYKALNELQKLRKQKLQEEIGFERKKHLEAAETRKADLHAVKLRSLLVETEEKETAWNKSKKRDAEAEETSRLMQESFRAAEQRRAELEAWRAAKRQEKRKSLPQIAIR